MEQIDYAVVLRTVGQTFFVFAALTFVIQYLYPKFKKLLYNRVSTTEAHNSENEPKLLHARDSLQELFREQAAAYKERVLIPREEKKLQKKENELRRFMGPAWKGQGDILGGEREEEEEEEMEETLPPGQMAARHRRLPEPEVTPAPASHSKPEQRKKRVIELPEEPDQDSKDCITVTLRTPIGQNWQRRFLKTHTVQVLLDFMTTTGFSQSAYTLSTSFPRQDLGVDPSLPLHLIPLPARVTLNVEEKDL